MKVLKKSLALLLAIIMITACLSSCSKKIEFDEDVRYYYVEMTVKNYGTILLKLDALAAPKTVENFIDLVNDGFYNGLTFHRVMKNFMIQGGDPEANGYGESKNKIYGEFYANGYDNPIKHKRGVISMARTGDPNSASCQFFICNSSSASVSNLDGYYAAFGYVVEGMDVVDAITEATAKYGDANGMIAAKRFQPVIKKVKVVDCE